LKNKKIKSKIKLLVEGQEVGEVKEVTIGETKYEEKENINS